MYITTVLSLLFLSSIYLLMISRSKLGELKVKDTQIEKVYEPASIEEKKLTQLCSEYSSLQSSYQEKRAELFAGENRLSLYHLGVGTTDSTSYTSLASNKKIDDIEYQLQNVKATLKRLVSEKKACVCSIGNDIVVNGKKSEAKKLFNREIKLRLRCLDNEFKAAVALVDWNNINRLIQRTKDTFEEINASGVIVKTYLQDQYLQMKIEELRLSYELKQLKQELKETEREEASIQREAEREEKRIKAAAEKAERERKLMEKLVAEELSKLESSTAEQKALYELHKQELEVLREKEKRAVSLAQVTRAGYVYVISNHMSFGDGIVKIGMTRRADPNDRVKELGDASVPELFDVHAFAFTDDAPVLEKYLHDKFAEHRVNLVNNRKEFFYVSPQKVLAELDNYEQPISVDKFDRASKSGNGEYGQKASQQVGEKNLNISDINSPQYTDIKSMVISQNYSKSKVKNFDEDNYRESITRLVELLHKIKIQKTTLVSINDKNIKIQPKINVSGLGSSSKSKSFVINEYPEDSVLQQEMYEALLESKQFMDKATQEDIKSFVTKEYPGDYVLQQEMYEALLESKQFMDKATQEDIKSFVTKEYPGDYVLQQEMYEEQLESKQFMDKATQEDIKSFVTKEYPGDYVLQQEMYEEQLESKQFMDKTTQEDIKSFVTKEYPGDYVMQQEIYEEQADE
ncbi:TPA: DUF4041 domain-containing protein [Vibrio parahaemolyticus]|nr:DUF4041 domain-containing protein [Vibrio parahaemolyticus]